MAQPRRGALPARGAPAVLPNHFHEFQRIDGHTALDLLVAHTDAALVRFELDAYWVVRGGADPLAWLHKLGDRCDLLHLGDLPATAQPVNWFDVFGADTAITMDDLLQTLRPEHFANVGEGTVDIPALVATVQRVGHARYLFVERCPTDRDELADVAISYANLARLLCRA